MTEEERQILLNQDVIMDALRCILDGHCGTDRSHNVGEELEDAQRHTQRTLHGIPELKR